MLRRAALGIAYFVDVAEEIDLLRLERLLEEAGYTPPEGVSRRRIPPPILLHPPLHRIRQASPRFEIRAYAFGILEIVHWQELPLQIGSLHDRLLGDLPPSTLQALRDELQRLLPTLRPALEGEGTGDEEFYRLILLVPTSPLDAETLWESLPLAAWLLGEDEVFSPQILQNLRESALSYTAHDLLLIGWDRTILVDPWEETEVLQLVEFALAQDLEWSGFDAYLERSMDAMYDLLRGTTRPPRRQLQELRTWTLGFLEAADRVRGGIKLTDDPYFARIYERALRVFGVPDIEASIQARLDYMERLLVMMENEQRDRRMELVEWGIFFLILLEILIWLAQEMP